MLFRSTTISNFFGRARSQRECKLKFKKFEKEQPGRLDKILMGIPEEIARDSPAVNPDTPTTTIDVKYKRLIEAKIGNRMQETEVVMAELKKQEEQHQREEEQLLQAAAADRKRKRDDILSGGASAKKRAGEILRSVEDDDEGQINGHRRGTTGSGREASAAPNSRGKTAPRKGKKNPHSSHGGGTEIVLETIET